MGMMRANSPKHRYPALWYSLDLLALVYGSKLPSALIKQKLKNYQNFVSGYYYSICVARGHCRELMESSSSNGRHRVNMRIRILYQRHTVNIGRFLLCLHIA